MSSGAVLVHGKRWDVPPDVRISVLAKALIVKAVNLSDLAAFVVASNQRDTIWPPHLTAIRDERARHFERRKIIQKPKSWRPTLKQEAWTD